MQCSQSTVGNLTQTTGRSDPVVALFCTLQAEPRGPEEWRHCWRQWRTLKSSARVSRFGKLKPLPASLQASPDSCTMQNTDLQLLKSGLWGKFNDYHTAGQLCQLCNHLVVCSCLLCIKSMRRFRFNQIRFGCGAQWNKSTMIVHGVGQILAALWVHA